MSMLHGLLNDGHRDASVLSVLRSIAMALFVVVGLLKCVQLTSQLALFVYRHYMRPGKTLSKYGKWAVVTGATDGIGREYCNALAKQGEATCDLALPRPGL
jgi:hypothetical protein